MTRLRGELPLRVCRARLHAPLDLRCRCGEGRPGGGDPALIRMAAHALACEQGATLAARDRGPLAGEQPVRLVRNGGNKMGDAVVLTCAGCGIEATSWRWGSHSESVRLRTHFRWPSMGTDLTLDGLGVLLRHCGTCEAALVWNPARESLPAALTSGGLW